MLRRSTTNALKFEAPNTRTNQSFGYRYWLIDLEICPLYSKYKKYANDVREASCNRSNQSCHLLTRHVRKLFEHPYLAALNGAIFVFEITTNRKLQILVHFPHLNSAWCKKNKETIFIKAECSALDRSKTSKSKFKEIFTLIIINCLIAEIYTKT